MGSLPEVTGKTSINSKATAKNAMNATPSMLRGPSPSRRTSMTLLAHTTSRIAARSGKVTMASSDGAMPTAWTTRYGSKAGPTE